MIGRSIAQYEVVEKLGEGGMGVVYKARDLRLNRFVVLKVLRSDALGDADRKRRFVQEARAASALVSPYIITIHDIAAVDGMDYIVMEYVPGQPLDYLIPTGGMPVDVVLRIATQICDALTVAHQAGIIHRDLKPANIMVTSAGHVKLLDFGLVKLTSTWSGGDVTGPKTVAGAVVGTVCYMSPEQALAQPVDARSDLFSLGTVLYEMTTGRRAFGNASAMLALTAVLRDSPPEPAAINPKIPAALNALIMRCLAKDPNGRPSSAAEVRALLGLTPPPADFCAQGFQALRTMSPASALNARQSFEQAMKSSDDHSQVYAGICEYYAQTVLLGLAEASEALPKALWAARKALDLDAANESVQVTVALLRANCDLRWQESLGVLERPLADRDKYRRGLWSRRPLGHFAHAMADVGSDGAARAWIALESGDVAAVEHFASFAERNSWIAAWARAWALIASGQARQAIEICSEALRAEPGHAQLESALAAACAFDGKTDRAHGIVTDSRWRPASFAMPVWAAAGETDLLFTAARDAVARRDPGLITAMRLPVMQKYRSDPRYTEVLRELNLA